MPHINKHIRKCLREPANPETFQSLSVTGKIPPQAHIKVMTMYITIATCHTLSSL